MIQVLSFDLGFDSGFDLGFDFNLKRDLQLAEVCARYGAVHESQWPIRVLVKPKRHNIKKNVFERPIILLIWGYLSRNLKKLQKLDFNLKRVCCW